MTAISNTARAAILRLRDDEIGDEHERIYDAVVHYDDPEGDNYNPEHADRLRKIRDAIWCEMKSRGLLEDAS